MDKEGPLEIFTRETKRNDSFGKRLVNLFAVGSMGKSQKTQENPDKTEKSYQNLSYQKLNYQKVTYEKVTESKKTQSQGGRSSFSLARAEVGDRLCIVSLNGEGSNNRLMGMGLMPGVHLKVVSGTGKGAIIVALNDNRFGLESTMAEKIEVMHSNNIFPSTMKPRKQVGIGMKEAKEASSNIKLGEVPIGSTLKVIGYAAGSRNYKRKLLAMGLTPGTELVVKRHAPLGDPTEIEVRGFHLSLRKDEANALMVEFV